MTTTNTAAAAAKTDTPAITPAPAPSHSERFTNAVIKEFSSNSPGELELTSFQKKLCQNYFIKIDMVLKSAEVKRLAKKNNQDPLPLTWDNVNMAKLANDVICYSSVGLDPTQPNHINPIPYKNKATNKYDITFIPGYRGVELKAKKYGMSIPDDIVVELVYSKDKFKPIKKDQNNKVESYVFQQSEEMDRGEIVGGFYYHNYFDSPQKNILKTFSKKDIDKRKPDSASAEFWGGERTKWENGKPNGTEEVEGWYDEMAFKTIYKAAYNSITIDSEKIDSNYVQLLLKESENKDNKVLREITENGNKNEVGFTDAEVVSTETTDTVDQQINKQAGDQTGAEQLNGQKQTENQSATQLTAPY